MDSEYVQLLREEHLEMGCFLRALRASEMCMRLLGSG